MPTGECCMKLYLRYLDKSCLHSDNVLLFYSPPPQKPLEVREGNVKPTDYKVCVLGLWAAQEADGKGLAKLVDALESGRWAN